MRPKVLPDRLRYLFALGILLLAGETVARSPEEWQRLGWVAGFERGLERARVRDRPAFVYFDAPWCSWCHRYQAQTLDEPSVRKRLARDFVPIVVDFDARPDLIERYRARGLPYTLILAPDGSVLNGFAGVLSAPDLLDVLARAKEARVATADVEPFADTVRPDGIDRAAYQHFRDAFMEHLERLYRPGEGTLAGSYATGATLKRPSPLTWIYLDREGLWPERSGAAAEAERARLWDRANGGFFNFLDPSHPEKDHLETSKLLEANAWLSVWMAHHAARDPEARAAALSGWFYLREVLWDRGAGGFFQAQRADAGYYGLDGAPRSRADPPPVERIKRADTNAQAAWALVELSRLLGEAQPADYAAGTLDFILRRLVRTGRLYHIERLGRLEAPTLPQDMFWVLAAAAELDALRPDPGRRSGVATVERAAAQWLRDRMRSRKDEELSVELAGLIAWVAATGRYTALPKDAAAWALGQLRIEPQTPPDELVVGLRAWAAVLADEASRLPAARRDS